MKTILPLHLLTLVACYLLLSLSGVAAERPTIVIILADDLGYGDLSSYGQKDFTTPHLDALAARGIRFTDAYAGAPVCAPSRSALLTGQHVGQTWVRGNFRRGMDPAAVALRGEDITIAELLQDAGYATGHIGKWGLGEADGPGQAGLPRRQGFDYFWGYLNHWHAHNSWPTFIWRNEERVELRNVVPDEDDRGAGAATVKVDFIPRLTQDEAVSFIHRQSDDADPFFLYVAVTPPHVNNERRPMGLEIENEDAYTDKPWPEAPRAWAELVQIVDRTVASVVRAVDDIGATDNTLILFSSDNGPHRENGGNPAFFNSSGGLRGFKRSVYEGGIRVPTIAVWPDRLAANTVSDLVWSFEDILPTLAGAAGIEDAIPDQVTGLNLLPAWEGGHVPATDNRFLFWEFHERGYVQASRRGDWKAVRPVLGEALELYHLPNDPGESRNLAAQHPDLIAEFEAFFATARLPNPTWVPGDKRTQ